MDHAFSSSAPAHKAGPGGQLVAEQSLVASIALRVHTRRADCVTLATVTVAGAIVQWHLDGTLSFDEARSAAEAVTPSHRLPPVATQSARRV